MQTRGSIPALYQGGKKMTGGKKGGGKKKC